VDAARLEFHEAFRDVLATVVADGVARGVLPAQDARLTAAAVVGAVGEALVGPLSSPPTPRPGPVAARAPSRPSSRSHYGPLEAAMYSTHEVTNQPPPLAGHDVAADDTLLAAVGREGAGWALEDVHALGRLAGSEQAQQLGRLAERYPPVLRTHDRYGRRIDEVEFNPAWHELMTIAVRNGLHAAPWRHDRTGAHVARAAKMYVWGNVDPGHTCPISMTYAVVPALRANAALAADFEPLLASAEYDFGLRPPLGKRGLIAGMSMTEKQGGSDVRANTTRAVPDGAGGYLLTGHKWFTSAPMSDVFLTLAQAPGGLSCFLLPRVLPDGTRNRIYLQRLKDKLGNRSNASAEIEYEEASGWLVGDEGRGVRTIIEMVNLTRLDCALGAATGMRAGAVQATHHAGHRRAFGALLVDQPLMRNVLADLAVESEAATLVAIRLAGAVDRAAAGDAAEAAFRRMALAVTKYWLCKRGPAHAAEALECLGGNGYVEDSGMPRLYREAPLLSIWEGSGNVAALDGLRAMAKEPASVEAYFAEIDRAAGADRRLDAAIALLRKEFGDTGDLELRARRLAETAALVLQGTLLVRYGDPAVADAFCASRLGGDWGVAFGTLPAGVDTARIIDRVRCEVPA
jgi:putative acyl-CoA dehydrogenase